MKKIVLASIPLFLIGCTTLDSSSDFTDAVKRIESKQNYQVVVGESLTPDVLEVKQGQLVNSSLELNYVTPTNDRAVPDSYITMELQYFKNYNEYRFARVKGADDKVQLKPYAASAETCSDICTQTQYVKFPVSNELFDEAPFKDLVFDIQVSNANSISFSVPAGYVEAIVNTGDKNTAFSPVVAAVAAVPVAAVVAKDPKASQAQEMVNYWYGEATKEEQSAVTDWAFKNRKNANPAPLEGSKEIEMVSYWFNKLDSEEKSQTMIWLLEQE